VAAAHGLTVMIVVTASAHFAPDGLAFMPGHAALTAMVPPFVPFPSVVVYGTGVLEQLVYPAVAPAAARSRTRGRKVNPLGLSVKDSTILSSYAGSTSKS
jgi:hypothetical protein